MQDEIKSLSQSILALQSVVMSSGHFKGKDPMHLKKKGKADGELEGSNSETAIYQNLVRQANQDSIMADEEDKEIYFNLKRNRQSSSSEGGRVDNIDTSDEMINIDCEQFIANCADEARKRKEGNMDEQVRDDRDDPFDHGQRMMKEAELAKAQVMAPPGRPLCRIPGFNNTSPEQKSNDAQNTVSSTRFDNEYMVVGGHIDSALQEKIINFKYIDFCQTDTQRQSQ